MRHRLLDQVGHHRHARGARAFSQAPIIAPTPSLETTRRLCLVWGTHSVMTEDIRDFDDMVKRASQIARQEGFAQVGERIVITAGVPAGHHRRDQHAAGGVRVTDARRTRPGRSAGILSR